MSTSSAVFELDQRLATHLSSDLLRAIDEKQNEPLDVSRDVGQIRDWLKYHSEEILDFYAEVMIKSFGRIKVYKANYTDKTSYVFSRLVRPNSQEPFVNEMANLLQRMREGVPHHADNETRELARQAIASPVVDSIEEWATRLVNSTHRS